MKVYVLLGVSSIEECWLVKTNIAIFHTRKDAEKKKKELELLIPPSGHYFHDEEIHSYEIEEHDVIGDDAQPFPCTNPPVK